MSKLITLTIDGKQVSVPEGTLIVDAAKKIGIDIPVFCYHPKMEPVGMCRMCLVDVGRPVIDRTTGEFSQEEDGSIKIQFAPKLETACTTPVSEGMVVIGASEKVKLAREDILEFLLTSHPLDCPVCDKGGECPLQNLTMGFGPGESRYLYDEKMHLAKQVPLGELICLDRERCIQCARCVRFQDLIAGDPVIGFYQRGRALEIVTYSEPGFNSYWSGNTTDICPVGALTTVDFRFGARPWELNAAASLCSHCPVGCNLTLNTRREASSGGKMVIKRVMPRQNEWVNEIWICDKGRFGYHYTEARAERLTQPLLRKEGKLTPVNWEEALEVVANRFRQASTHQEEISQSPNENGLLILAGGRLANEDLFNLRTLAESVGGQTALYSHMAGGDLVAQVGLGEGSNFSDMGAGTTILVIACDLEEEAPIWWLRVKQAAERGATVIIANPRATKLDKSAHFKLRYPYGGEAATVMAMLNTFSAKRPNLPPAYGEQVMAANGETMQKLARSPELQAAAQAFANAENSVILYGSEGIGLPGSQALAQACANLLISTNHTGRTNNGVLAVWSRPNEQGAWDLGFQPRNNLKQTLRAAKALYVVAADPAGDDPALAETSDFLVVQDLFLTDTAKLADVVLPAQAFTEREGSYTSGERRVQRFYPAVPALPDCLPDFKIAGLIGQRLGLDIETRIPSKVFNQLAARVPDYATLSYARLAEVADQWPVVGREDLYYGGTTYQNRQGLGVQLSPSAQRGELTAMKWQEPPNLPESDDGLLAVPITRLYDRGQTLKYSALLARRLSPACVILHTTEAERRGVKNGDLVQVQFENASALASICLNEQVPVGVVLVPRSVGIPLTAPQWIKLQLAERVKA